MLVQDLKVISGFGPYFLSFSSFTLKILDDHANARLHLKGIFNANRISLPHAGGIRKLFLNAPHSGKISRQMFISKQFRCVQLINGTPVVETVHTK